MQETKKSHILVGIILILLIAFIFLGIAYDKKGQSPTKDGAFITFHFLGQSDAIKIADSIAYFGQERNYLLLGNISTTLKEKASDVHIKLYYQLNNEEERVITENNVVCDKEDLNTCLQGASVFVGEQKGYDEFFPQDIIDNFSKGLHIEITYKDTKGEKVILSDINLSFEKFVNNKLDYEQAEHI